MITNFLSTSQLKGVAFTSYKIVMRNVVNEYLQNYLFMWRFVQKEASNGNRK